MEEAQILILTFLFLSLTFFFIGRIKRKQNLPPSPPFALPIIGHLRLLKPPLHRAFLSVSQSLGDAPVFSLRLGNRLVFVVSSHSIAEECFTKNDVVVLANRPHSVASKHISYDYTTMASASYSEHWRNLRRIGAVEIFSAHRLNLFSSIRRNEIRRFIARLSRNSSHVSNEFAKVEMRSMFSDLTFNNIIRMLAGKRYYGDGAEDDPEAKRVRQLIAEAMSSFGAGNAVDYVPVLRWVTDFEKRIKKLADRLDEFLQGLVDEKRAEKEKGNTMIDHLLSLQETQPEYYTDRTIKGIILSLILAGTDTSAVMNKARDEIDKKVGFDRLVEESDFTKLPYLQNIVSETLRLYPAGPLLVPHVASEDCNVGGYDMPRGTMLLVNLWAIHRDPQLWDDPEAFNPERFDKEGEALSLTLGSLIQCFEWERIGEEEVDMTEAGGVTMPKARPLIAMCRARASVGEILHESN
ncbi:hypothetical protein EUTSA_v10025129mg [Eutrema salsugineum]|uniref:Cytochrome P450 n=1 Tax=Eutrema salsugineum TaxID=72664 RepID=V4MDQ1_EUTSA|nr:hypothetical protein EUTSA_v10025129mg [Eutrema salsugineum]